MCLEANEVFKKPIKEMIGWKILGSDDGGYYTPFTYIRVKKNRKYLIAKGKKDIRKDFSLYLGSMTKVYHGGFIHAYRTRSMARVACGDMSCRRVIKVKCYNVIAFGVNGDLVCDKIEFLWGQR